MLDHEEKNDDYEVLPEDVSNSTDNPNVHARKGSVYDL